MILLDTFAVVELLLKTDIGKKVINKIKNEEFFILTTNIAEFTAFCEKNNLPYEEVVESFLFNVKDVNFEMAIQAGKLYQGARIKSPDISLIDIILLAAAKKLNAKILTGDSDFKGFPEAIFLS